MLDGSEAVALEWSLAGLALVFVLLRLYVRIYSRDGRLDWSDYIVVWAWLNFAACCACDTVLHKLEFIKVGNTYIGDLSRVNPDPEKNTQVLKIIYGSFFPYLIDLWLIKASILSFYYTIIPRTLPVYRLFLHFTTGICMVSFILVFLANMFWCDPIRTNWSLNPEELCVSSSKLPPFYGSIGSNIITDLLIFFLPFPLLQSIHLPKRKMIGVIFLFTLGFLTIIASICRVTVISISADVTMVTAWTAVECSTGIIVACIPALRVLIIRCDNPNTCSENISTRCYTRPGPQILSPCDRNEIWDGTDATAPQWIRMASLPCNKNINLSPMEAQFDEAVIEALSKQLTPTGVGHEYGSNINNFDMVAAIPNIRLQLGRGIVENGPMLSPISPVSPCISFPDNMISGPTSPQSSIMSVAASNSNLIRLEGSDDVLPCVLNRWDTSESGRLELGRIVDTVAGVNRPKSILVPNDRKGRLGVSNLNPDYEREFLK